MANPHPEEINPRLWYGTCKAAYFLGIDKNTVLAKAKIGSSNGGLDYKIDQSNGRKKFHGKELLRYLYG